MDADYTYVKDLENRIDVLKSENINLTNKLNELNIVLNYINCICMDSLDRGESGHFDDNKMFVNLQKIQRIVDDNIIRYC